MNRYNPYNAVYASKRPSEMGWEWSDVGSWFSDVGEKTAEELSNQLPGQIANQLNQQLFPTSGGGTTTVQTTQQGGTSYVQSAAQAMNVPPAVIYGMMGLMGVGVLLVLVKAIKS